MRLLKEDEARVLFLRPLVCEDCCEWKPWVLQPNTVIASAGVLHDDGMSARLFVELLYSHSPKTRLLSYRFSVFQRSPWANEPAYQLHICQSSRGLKDAHKKPHEHMGDKRTLGDAAWADWEYDQVLDYFSARTNIRFEPRPGHPEHFSLKG